MPVDGSVYVVVVALGSVDVGAELSDRHASPRLTATRPF
jgi:hypothetical protein